MNNACHRSLRSGANIGRRARDRTRRRQPAKHRRDNVGHALRDQFDVRVMPVIAHAVSNHSRHQGFNRSQHRNSERRSEQAVNQIGTEPRNMQMRQARGNPAESRSNRFHRQLEKIDGAGRQQQRHDRPRNPRRQPAADDQRQKREYRQRGRFE